MKRPVGTTILSFFHDERGTAITEFVITLPVFVLSFVAILHLYKIEDLAVQGKAASYADALEDHRQLQTSYFPFDWSITPATGGARAGIWHNRVSQSWPRDRVSDIVVDGAAVLPGHMFESWTRLAVSGPPNWVADSVGLKQPIAFKTMNGLLNSTWSDSHLDFHRDPKRRGDDNYESMNSAFALDLLDDMAGLPNLSAQESWMGYANEALNVGGVRPAIGAGMRYGVAEGEYDESTQFMRRTYTVQSDTHLAAPTRPTSKWLSLALIRLRLGQNPSYNHSILAFEMDLNVNDPAAQAASDCQSQLENIDTDSISGVRAAWDTFQGIKGGDPCGSGGNGLGGDPFAWLYEPLSTIPEFFGTSRGVPQSLNSGAVPQSSDWP